MLQVSMKTESHLVNDVNSLTLELMLGVNGVLHALFRSLRMAPDLPVELTLFAEEVMKS